MIELFLWKLLSDFPLVWTLLLHLSLVTSVWVGASKSSSRRQRTKDLTKARRGLKAHKSREVRRLQRSPSSDEVERSNDVPSSTSRLSPSSQSQPIPSSQQLLPSTTNSTPEIARDADTSDTAFSGRTHSTCSTLDENIPFAGSHRDVTFEELDLSRMPTPWAESTVDSHADPIARDRVLKTLKNLSSSEATHLAGLLSKAMMRIATLERDVSNLKGENSVLKEENETLRAIVSNISGASLGEESFLDGHADFEQLRRIFEELNNTRNDDMHNRDTSDVLMNDSFQGRMLRVRQGWLKRENGVTDVIERDNEFEVAPVEEAAEDGVVDQVKGATDNTKRIIAPRQVAENKKIDKNFRLAEKLYERDDLVCPLGCKIKKNTEVTMGWLLGHLQGCHSWNLSRDGGQQARCVIANHGDFVGGRTGVVGHEKNRTELTGSYNCMFKIEAMTLKNKK